jgi:hypothetical protein
LKKPPALRAKNERAVRETVRRAVAVVVVLDHNAGIEQTATVDRGITRQAFDQIAEHVREVAIDSVVQYVGAGNDIAAGIVGAPTT